LIVGSAASYPHGVVDDISSLSRICVEKDIWLHVDACLGGYILPFLKQLGANIPDFDFRLPGVTSMSADTHKYGYSVKGSSTILYRNADYRRYQYFVLTEWAGAIYPTATMGGSRPGCLIAGTWASLMHMGMNGYLSCARKIKDTYDKIVRETETIEGVDLLVRSNTMIISYASKDIDIFMVADLMNKRGFVFNYLQKPNAIHFCITYKHADCADQFVSDFKQCVKEIRDHPELPKSSGARAYGMAYSIPDRASVETVAKLYLDVCLEV